jgi:FkbM family methyltransferase
VLDLARRVRLQALMARQLVNWRDAWRTYSSGVAVHRLEFRNGAVLQGGPRDSAGFLFLEIFANGCYRRGLPVPLSGVAIDIGANIGAFTLDMAMRNPDLTIHAYEPDPDAFAMLLRNIEGNRLSQRVRAWNEAVAGRPGTLQIFRGDGSITASAHLPTAARGDACRVPAVTLQTAVQRCGARIALLKMDCEGSEAEILETGVDALDAIDRIVAEYHPALVSDVVPRIRRVLDPAFDVAFSQGRRCGPMLRAFRR